MTTTLAQLRTRALEHADLVSSSFITTSELDGFINGSGGELWDILQTRYVQWVTTPEWTEFTLTGSSYRYTPSSDCLQLVGLDMQDGSDWIPLRRTNPEERGRWRSAGTTFLYSNRAANRAYQFFGREICIQPEESAAGTYRFRYVQAWTPLTSSAQTIDLPNGWEEFIAVDAAIKCKQKGERDSTSLEQRKMALGRRIESAAANRDVSEQEFISDPDSNTDWWR